MKILVGSNNPVKIEAVKEGFSKYFQDIEVQNISVNSEVSHQPIDEETFHGAKNRVLALQKADSEEKTNADFFVGIEGGIIQLHSKWFVFGCICIMDKTGKLGFGLSPMFELPKGMTAKLLQGEELGTVVDTTFGLHNVKQKGGAIGYFTNGVITRKDFYVPGVITALVPFLNEKHFFEDYSPSEKFSEKKS